MDKSKNKKHFENEKEEKLFYANGNYYTREEFFNPDEEDDVPERNLKWIKITITFLLTLALIGNVLAFWPKIYNFASNHFLQISDELSNKQNVQLYKESVVVVRAGNSKGTGFYFNKEGHIMTNHHVIENEAMITVTFHDGQTISAEILSSNSDIDVAILKINPKDLEYPILDFAKGWKPNQPIYVIGNPIGYNFIVNQGKTLGQTTVKGVKVPVLMIDTPIYKGNSGSPVINSEGKVIGIVYATIRIEENGEYEQVGLAIPIEYLRSYYDEI